MKKIIELAKFFSTKLKEIVNGIKSGVQMFKSLISGNPNLKKIIDDFVSALTNIPNKASKFCLCVCLFTAAWVIFQVHVSCGCHLYCKFRSLIVEMIF
jgi:hypothetical protein